MGATQSTESVLTAVVLASALGLGCHYYYYTTSTQEEVEEENNATTTASADANSDKKSKKKKKKKGLEASSSSVVPTSTSSAGLLVDTIPGQFDQPQPPLPVPPTSNLKTKKPKKKASATKPIPSSSSPPARKFDTVQDASSNKNTEGSWTRVVPRRRQAGSDGGAADEHESIIDVTTSDAGITSSVTGNSSPIEKEEEEAEAQVEEGKGKEGSTIDQLQFQTLAERLVPKNPQTKVDDMLPDHNQPTLSRVMRVQPLPDEKPLPGFSWKDYEDVDADGEDDGWGVVKSKRTRPSGASASTSASTSATLKPASSQQPAQTQKQRQNAKKREAEKAAKAGAEADRVAALAKHKRELEKARIIEQSRSGGKTGGKVSGGMAPVVDSAGKLVWE